LLRKFLEQGFQIAVVKGATAGPRHPEWGDGYQAAMINYRFVTHEVLSTDETGPRAYANRDAAVNRKAQQGAAIRG
jgi:hypothetical protein